MSIQRTDLALEAHELWQGSSLSGVKSEETLCHGFPLHRVIISSRESAKQLGKPEGTYLTLELEGLLRREADAFPRAVEAVAALLRPMLPEGAALVAGLGNRAITPDLLGPLTAEHTLVTRHLVQELPEHFGAFRPTTVLTPGVLATTGVESGDLIHAAVKQFHPACVIAIDALAAQSVHRLCRTVQISDTGIVPGSGVGNHRVSLSRETLGVPVLAVGVPTVAEFDGGGFFVTPKEIDSRVADLSRVIGYGISLALTPELTLEELDLLLS